MPTLSFSGATFARPTQAQHDKGTPVTAPSVFQDDISKEQGEKIRSDTQTRGCRDLQDEEWKNQISSPRHRAPADRELTKIDRSYGDSVSGTIRTGGTAVTVLRYRWRTTEPGRPAASTA